MTGQDRPRELAAFLAGVPLFAPPDETTRLQLAEQLEPVHMVGRDVVIAQDEPGDGLYLLLSGRLRVSVAAGGTEHVLHDLARGSVVGEIGFLGSSGRRTASVTVAPTDRSSYCAVISSTSS